ncbi:MAG: FKBP-type peptidyl-prolyl cis-trans isomerase [Candidatus Sifarchaeia archaeon]|jgi:peptidylprolyl isomerase
MSEAEEIKIDKGDFILIDYIGRIKDSGQIFALTNEEIAKKEKMHRDDGIYGPELVVVGERWVVEGLDDALLTLKVGEQDAIVEIPPEKAFGGRDPSRVKTIPIREFRKRDLKPQAGMTFRYKGSLATVQSASGGRVRLDLNHPLAGKILSYEVTVLRKIEDMTEKIKELMKRRISTLSESIEIDVQEDKVSIKIPKEFFFTEGLQFAKSGMAGDIHKFFEDITSVEFLEVYERS